MGKVSGRTIHFSFKLCFQLRNLERHLMGFYNRVNIEHSPNVYSAQLVMFLETNSNSSRNI